MTFESMGKISKNNWDNFNVDNGLINQFVDIKRAIGTLEKYIKEFLTKEGYKKLIPEFGNTELDIVGGTFLPYDAWVEKTKIWYREIYLDDVEEYFTDKMNHNTYFGEDKIEPNREKDFENFCKDNYEGPYTVKHLLFGESFIGELK